MSPFSYWDRDDQSKLSGFRAEWSDAFRTFRIYGDRDVVPLVEQYSPEHVDVYRSIRIPAAKADVARLLLLHHCGGLYIDCHMGIRDAREIHRLLSSLEKMELILVDRAQFVKPRPADEHFFINGIIFSRPRSVLMKMAARQAFANLSCHREFERLAGRIPYHIGRLTGGWVLTNMVLQPGSNNRDIRFDYEGRIKIVAEEVAPIERNRHQGYREPGQHWFERQKVEVLFEQQSNSTSRPAATKRLQRLTALKRRLVLRHPRLARQAKLLQKLISKR